MTQQWRIFTLTGLSETVFTPPVDLANAGPPSFGRVSFYADLPSSITSGSTVAEGMALAGWSTANIVTGTPLVVTDSVVGGRCIRTSASDAIATPARAADFLSAAASTIAIVWRTRKYNYGGSSYPIIDTTDGGTVPGFQLLAREDYAFGDNRRFEIRIWDGAQWRIQLPSTQNAGHWIPLKWHIIVVRLTATTLDIRIDGRYVDVNPETVTFTYPAVASGKITIGKGPSDYKAIELYDSSLSDSDTSITEHRLAVRFNVDLITRIAGDLRLPASATSYVGFPGLTRLASGSLRCTYFVGATESTNGNRVDIQSSSDNGADWFGLANVNTSTPSNCLANINITVLRNGDWVGTSYNIASASIQHLMFYRSTNQGATWSVTNVPTLGGAAWEGCSGFIVEDPVTDGKLYWPVYTGEGGTYYHVWAYVSTNGGTTWPTRNRIANGDTDHKYWAEPDFEFRSGEMYCLLRDAEPPDFFAPPNEMFQSRSTNSSVTWTAPVTTTLQADSAGQSLMQLASGRDVWVGRPGGRRMAAIFHRAPGAAWNGAWSNIVATPGALWIDFIHGGFGGMSYAGLVETSPGVMTIVWGATTDADHDDVCCRPNFYEWYLTFAMPGSATPLSASVVSLATQQITTTGAGSNVYAFTANVPGSSINSTTGVFTAGTTNGTSVFTVTDCNGQLLGTCSYTVTGGAGVAAPDTLPNLTSWFRADTGVTLNTGHVSAMTAKGGTVETTMSQATGGNQPTFVASGINSLADITFDGGDSLIGTNALLSSSTTVTLWGTFQTTTIGTASLWGMQYNGFHYGVFLNYSGATPGQISIVVAGTTITSPLAYNDNAPHVWVASIDLGAGTMSLYVDGTSAVVTGAPSGTFSNGAGDLNAAGAATGAGPVQDRLFTGHMPEWGSYSDAKSGSAVTTLITYLKSRAGL